MTVFTLASIPAMLVGLRFLLAGLLLLDAIDAQASPWFVGVYITAVVSDIFDGIIARRLGVSTASLRQADSWADRWLYACIAIAAWLLHRDIILAFRLPLLTVIGLQVLWWIVNLAKYGKPACYHTYTAKVWGITLLVAAIALFGFNYGGITLELAVLAGIIHTVEEMIMTLILPTWQHDVLSLVHALRLRKALMSESSKSI